MLASLLLFAFFQPQAAAAAKPAKDVVIWPHGVSALSETQKEDFGNHALSITHREFSGIAEVHVATANVMVVQSGEATLVYGGEVIDPQVTEPYEIRGLRIFNGTSRHVSAGDVIHLPAGMPQQWLVDTGKQVTYLVVHIEEPPTRKP